MAKKWKPNKYFLERYGEEENPLVVLEIGPSITKCVNSENSGLDAARYPLFRDGKPIYKRVWVYDIQGSDGTYRWCIVALMFYIPFIIFIGSLIVGFLLKKEQQQKKS